MSWENADLSQVVEQAKTPFTPIPEGVYKLRLLGAKPDNYNPTSLALDFAVAEGQYAGRRIFPTLPDPSVKTWSLGAASKLASALGITQNKESGEGIQEMFNRAATNGQALVQAQVTVEDFTKRDGTPGSNNKVQLFSFEATA